MDNRRIGLLAIRPPLTALATAFAVQFATAAEPPASAAHASASTDQDVTLVVHTAKDCPVCARWRASDEGLPVALALPRAWPHLHLVFIEREHLNGSESESLYPAALAPLFDERRARYQTSPPVPLFEIVWKGRIISRHAGLADWTEETVPELQELKSRLESAASQ